MVQIVVILVVATVCVCAIIREFREDTHITVNNTSDHPVNVTVLNPKKVDDPSPAAYS